MSKASSIADETNLLLLLIMILLLIPVAQVPWLKDQEQDQELEHESEFAAQKRVARSTH